MIITCPECSTRFDVAPERIPDAGVKMRCARCKHIFLAQKPLAEESATAIEEINPPEQTAESEVENTFDQDKLEAPAAFSASDTGESDFDYDKFQELDTDRAASEEFTFGTDDEEDLTPSTGSNRKATSGSSATDFTIREQIEATDLIAPAGVTPAKKSTAFSILIKALLLIILAALIVGGAMLYFSGPEEINQKIRQYFGQATQTATQIGQISLGTLEGRFLTSEQAGEIFLIRGEAINNFDQPRSAIQVKGVLYDQHGKPLMQKTVFCGNQITDEQLRTLPFEELEQMMGNQFGKDLSNMKIDPRKSIPFDIVFKDLPRNISEFSVKVTASRPTAN